MKPIKSSGIVYHSDFKLFVEMIWLNLIGYGFMKLLFSFFLISIFCTTHAQFGENNFKKIFIEIDGEEVFDVDIITQDHQGYIWMTTNLGLIRYNGLEGEKYDVISDDSPPNVNAEIETL